MELRKFIHTAMEHPLVFNLTQRAFPFTVHRYHALIEQNISIAESASVLDIGCGVGAYRSYLGGRYTGIDINPDYIATAKDRYPDASFHVMDCENLDLGSDGFDHAITIATFHHISDEGVRRTVREALRVLGENGTMHVIDAIYPVDRKHALKHWIFAQDRGAHQRHVDELESVLSSVAQVRTRQISTGFPHDVAYFAVSAP